MTWMRTGRTPMTLETSNSASFLAVRFFNWDLESDFVELLNHRFFLSFFFAIGNHAGVHSQSGDLADFFWAPSGKP